MVVSAVADALAAPQFAGQARLSLPSVSSITRNTPGSFKETQVFTEQSLSLNSRLSWETSTGLSATQYTQTLPLRAQSARLTTGPRLRWGRFELAMPVQSGQELGSGQAEVVWTSNAPRISFDLSPDDKIWLEARVQHRTEQRQAALRKSRKSVGINWRHTLSDRYWFRTGIGHHQDIVDHGAPHSLGTEVYAQWHMWLPDRWQMSVTGSLQSVSYPSPQLATPASRDHHASVALSASRGLGGGWSLTGSFSVDQNQSGGLNIPIYTQSGRLRLTRDF